MKLFLAVIGLFVAINLRAQYVPPTPAEDAMSSQILERAIPSTHGALTLQQPKPNEISANGKTYSGILVELAKTRQPLQLVNPVAQDYGSAEDNTVHDLQTGRATGLKLFSISF